MIHDHIEIDIHRRSVFILRDPVSVFDTLLHSYWNMIYDVLFCSASWIQSK